MVPDWDGTFGHFHDHDYDHDQEHKHQPNVSNDSRISIW